MPLQASLSAKAAELDASQARVGELELQLVHALEKGSAHSQRLATLQVGVDGALSGWLASLQGCTAAL